MRPGASSGERARAGSRSPRRALPPPSGTEGRGRRLKEEEEVEEEKGGRPWGAGAREFPPPQVTRPGSAVPSSLPPGAPRAGDGARREGRAGVRLGRPPSPPATRASAARRQVGSRRALATEAADPGRAALGPGVRPPAPLLLEPPPFLPLSAGGARSREVVEKLLPPAVPRAGGQAGGRACLPGALPAGPQPRSPFPSSPSRSCESPTGSLVDVGAAVAPCVLKGFGSLASEGEREAGEWPLLVLAARGLCRLTPASTFRSEDWDVRLGWGGGESW